MKLKNKITSILLSGAVLLGSINLSFADGANVVTLGANLSSAQREAMLKYFGVNENEVVVVEVNNQQERKYLQGVATESQLGKKTFSCAYVEPTKRGSGINVKTANITWATSSMIASILSTVGIEDANVVAAAPFPVSGTGMLTGIMIAFEDATGKPLDETKKEIASEELIITGDLADQIGGDAAQDKATGIINDIKTDIIKNNTSDTVQIAETINNITNNYNITLTPEQEKQIQGLMEKISEQDYDYNSIKNALNSVKDNVNDSLIEAGVIKPTFFESIKDWFSGIGEWISGIFSGHKDLGILQGTNDSMLGEDAQIDSTDKEAINLPSSDEVEGFFAKIWNWFTGLFNSNEDTNSENTTDTSIIEENNNGSNNIDNSSNNTVNSLEENSTVNENVQPDLSITDDNEDNNSSNNDKENTSIDDSINNEDN